MGPNEETYRRQWRELLFRTPNMNEAISSAILYEETLFQNAEDGTPFVDIMKANNVIPGIKVGTGVRATFMDGETITEGIDGLAERAAKYYKQGARFAKWRGVLRIDPNGAPSMEAIEGNARALAQYGKICQMNGLVPIIEPEVLMDGPHGIEVQAWVTEKVQAATMKALSDVNIEWEGMLLKPNMILPGGQSEEEATRNLNAMNKLYLTLLGSFPSPSDVLSRLPSLRLGMERLKMLRLLRSFSTRSLKLTEMLPLENSKVSTLQLPVPSTRRTTCTKLKTRSLLHNISIVHTMCLIVFIHMMKT